jgi:hypothetical protein
VIASQQTSVILAEAGIHVATAENQWIPAFAGMTIGNLTTTHFGDARRVERRNTAAELKGK